MTASIGVTERAAVTFSLSLSAARGSARCTCFLLFHPIGYSAPPSTRRRRRPCMCRTNAEFGMPTASIVSKANNSVMDEVCVCLEELPDALLQARVLASTPRQAPPNCTMQSCESEMPCVEKNSPLYNRTNMSLFPCSARSLSIDIMQQRKVYVVSDNLSQGRKRHVVGG